MNAKPPKLEKLKTERCTPEEMQVAIVELAELHNKLVNSINEMISSSRIRSRKEAIWEREFTI